VGVPAATVRGWLRRASAHAERVRHEATRLAYLADPLLGPAEPSGSALGTHSTHWAAPSPRWYAGLGPIGAPWPLAAIIAGGLLAPLRN
jgi:hypothetical protein